MKTDEIMKINLTLKGYQAKLVREAAKKLMPCYDGLEAREQNKDHRRVIMLALFAFCRAAINDTKEIKIANFDSIIGPMVAQLRAETQEECQMRINGHLYDYECGELSEQELSYCQAEDIDPVEFLKRKTA